MYKINLVPEVQEKKLTVAKTNTAIIAVSLGSLGLVAGVILIIFGMATANRLLISRAEDQIKKVQEESAQYADLEATVLSLEKGLAAIKQIFDGQNSWTKLLPHLEAATPGDIRYSTLGLEPGKITATLIGNNIDSLARFVDSYKAYQVIVLTGTGTWGNTVTLSVDGSQAQKANVKSDGTWKAALHLNPGVNHEITVAEGENTAKLIYDSLAKTVTSDGGITATVKNLFSEVIVKQYSKTDGLNFNATLNFDGGALW